MKKLLILLFSILISFNSYGEWTRIIGSADGEETWYIDKYTIKESGGYVYWWEMVDYLKPDKFGDMSNKLYFQGDCGVSRVKTLSYNFYKQPMGNGESEVFNPPSSEWHYAVPNTAHYDTTNWICDYVK